MTEATTTETTTETTETTTAPSSYTPPATQAELDRIIADRVNRTKNQFKDYADLKAKAGKYDELEEASKSAEQRAREAAEAAEARATAATQRAVRAEVKAIATGEFADPSDAHLYLGDLSRFIQDDGDVDSGAIEAALKEVEKAKPHLVAHTRTDVGVGARGGSAPTDMNQIIRDAGRRR